ncbi:hypothetical protein IEQ34_016917 [Dendrobium chrysotoxum]|uniref:Uncharacterized protein n=1 Tax=Dendrobium chrysotoxum TaxID=161865 RepID=A0AAV7GGZ4_DENCH|nr:hypothetical protein IEQ34_016917 [Dendrobium chrysotoxum]
MRLIRCIYRQLCDPFAIALAQSIISCRGKRADHGFARAAVDDAAAESARKKSWGEFEHIGHPVHNDGFKLGGGRGSDPAESDDVEAGTEHLSGEAGSASVGLVIGIKIGALPVGEAGKDVCFDVVENGGDG